MSGWFSWASVRCSSAKRSRRAGDSHASRRILIAASLPKSSRRARYTTPMPPSPSSRVMRYGPKVSGSWCGAPRPNTSLATCATSRSRSDAPRASSSSSANTSSRNSRSPPHSASRNAACSAVGSSAAWWKSSWMRVQRSASMERSVRRRLPRAAQLAGEPRPGRAPVAQDRRFGHAEQRARLRDVETAEEAVFHHQCLPRMNARQFFQCFVERQQIVGRGRSIRGHGQRVVERDDRNRAAALRCLTATRRFDEYLAHRPRRDALEVQQRHRRELGRLRELEPRFVDERRRRERRVGIVAPYGGGETPQLLVRRAEEVVERAAFVERTAEVGMLESMRWKVACDATRHDGILHSAAQGFWSRRAERRSIWATRRVRRHSSVATLGAPRKSSRSGWSTVRPT